MCCILYTNFITLFVIINTMPPKCWLRESYFPHNSRNTTLKGEDYGDQNFEDQVLNYPMDKDGIINTNDGDDINRLIQDTFSPLDEENLHDIHDVPHLEKSKEPLYEGSTTNILSIILLLVNLKVLNGLSNTCFTQLLRYVKLIIFLYF